MTKLSMTHPAVLFALAGVCVLALALWPPPPVQPAMDFYFHNTYFVLAFGHVAIGVGFLFALCASVYWLFPKFFGRNLSTSLAQLHFWLSVLAILATAISWLWVKRLTGSTVDSGSLTAVMESRQFLAFMLTTQIAILIFLLAQAIFLFNLLRSLLKGSQP